jgi:hypothetical protein
MENGRNSPDQRVWKTIESLDQDVDRTRSFLDGCDLPAGWQVQACVTLLDGSVVGAAVQTHPPTTTPADCIANNLRGFAFPRFQGRFTAAAYF